MRERLGGLMSCGVFASILSLSCPLLCPLSCPFALVFAFLFTSLLLLSSFVLLSSACPLSLWVVVASFSLTDYAQKERAQSVVLCVLSRRFVQSFKFL